MNKVNKKRSRNFVKLDKKVVKLPRGRFWFHLLIKILLMIGIGLSVDLLPEHFVLFIICWSAAWFCYDMNLKSMMEE